MRAIPCIFTRRNTITLLLLLTVAPAAFADKWFPAPPCIYAAPSGRFGLKVIPDFAARADSPARAVLFTLDETGREIVVWDKPLLNTPARVIVLDDGKHVVTIDTYQQFGGKHSLVIYGGQGQVVADFKLEDLLTADEIEKNVPKNAAFRLWTEKADIRALLDANRVEIVLAWGRTIKIDMGTGKIE
ncbi:MAG: hypothetical protein JWL69_238 [Phycisphaerales bacterium]|nr:hypothetical protein [Phycisphaerales bacterium]